MNVNAKIKITVDPAGRVLVWENEQLLPSDRRDDGFDVCAGSWHTQPGAVSYMLDVTLPVPSIDKPVVRVCADYKGRRARSRNVVMAWSR